MLFNSIEFAVFFVIVMAAYHVLSFRWQNRMLLVASYVFYGWWDWRFLSLIVLSTIIDYFCGLRIDRAEESSSARQWPLVVSMVANLGTLGVFKYYNFFAESLSASLHSIGVTFDLHFAAIVLPVGISFYTFQTMSYTIDIYRGRMKPTRQFETFALFVAFFPQLVAGPIERAAVLLPQLSKPRRTTREQFEEACWLILSGFYLKVVLADNMAPFVQQSFANPQNTHGMEVLIAIYAAAFQIYGDFAGYSRIARGIAKLMGIDLMKNFNRPYLAISPSDFWRRWHISLSSWLRDYLYIPLGGNRLGRTYRNLMITMILGGLWHGASWHFVAWGFYHGLLLVAFKVFEPEEPSFTGIARWVRVVGFFHLTCFGWLLFFVSDLNSILILGRNLFSISFGGQRAFLDLTILAAPVLISEIVGEIKRREYPVFHLPAPLRIANYAALLFCICFFGAISDIDFIYFQF